MMRLSRLLCESAIIKELKDEILNFHNSSAPLITKLKVEHGNDIICDTTVNSAYDNMRDITALVYEGSMLLPDQGITVRGLNFKEIQQKLPKAPKGGQQPLPEGIFWLLLTGKVPTEKQVVAFNEEIQSRACSLDNVKRALNALPYNMEPLTQYSIGVQVLQYYSKFMQAYQAGKANKTNYWALALDDALDCFAHTPQVAAMVFKNIMGEPLDVCYKNTGHLDWAANFAEMIGLKGKDAHEAMRLLMSLHADHEGGNITTHTAILVASALSDPYLSYACGLNALAGVAQGSAAADSLNFIKDIHLRLAANGISGSDKPKLVEAVKRYCTERLERRNRIPGFGGAVLVVTDPRYTLIEDFCIKAWPEDELFRISQVLAEVVPQLLEEKANVRKGHTNPNIELNIGVMMRHAGISNGGYLSVLHGLSRQMGIMNAIMWDRLQGKPIERPKTLTSDFLFKKYGIV